MGRFAVPTGIVSTLILLVSLTAGLVSANGPTPPPPTITPPPDDTVTQTSVADLVALISLYKATDGPNWRYNTNWLSETPVGEWHGVSTDSSGRVVGLDLPQNGLSGTIPSELGRLTNLRWLSLSSNQLSGEIPPELGDLTNLESLYLLSNELSGEIPPELSGLANLQSLWLYNNQLSGEIPLELGDLANLVKLSLEGNQLSGDIPSELGDLANLQSLILSRNELIGDIPSDLGNLANLEWLVLSDNQLTGEIPPELGKLTNLAWLALSGNDLTGEIPSELGNLANLQWLYLSSNQLEGCIPWGLGGAENNDLGELGLPFCSASGDPAGNVMTEVRVEAVPNAPNTVAKWVVQFENGTISNMDAPQMDGGNTMNINTNEENNVLNGGTGKDVIMVQFEDDVQFPEAVSSNDVVITTNMVWDGQVVDRTVVANPLGVDIVKVAEFAGYAQRVGWPPDETLVTLEIPDMEPADDRPGFQGIAPGATVTVTFRQNAGIKNPTESKADEVYQAERAEAVDSNGNFDASLLKPLSGYKVQVATSNNGYFVPAAPGNRAVIPRRLVLSDMDGPRGSTVTVVGVGFRNSITAVIWNDQNQNGVRDSSGEVDLGHTLITGSDDFTTTITINNPPFNYDLNTNGINAMDGRSRTIIPGRRYVGAVSGGTFTESIPTYLLESSIKVSPSTVSIGDLVRVTARDFVPGGNLAIARITLGGVSVAAYNPPVVDSAGDATFDILIPHGVAPGRQTLVIRDGHNAPFNPSHDIVNTAGARFNMFITGLQISVVPDQGLAPNQTVTLVGRGFSLGGSAQINVDGSDASISGDDTDLGPRSEKFNEGNPIEVDNAGNWSSSFILPVTDVTTTPGNHELSITDTGGRSGSAILNMAERQFGLDPTSGRVGARVDFKGVGFPADNPAKGAEAAVTVEIQYSIAGSDPKTVATITPDAAGNISGWFTVPLGAGIPSTNPVRAVFEIPANGVTVTTSAVHQVPRASITLDKESGPAGTVVTINGEGFKSNTSVSEINFGALDVRSDFDLSTDGEGTFETTFLVPGVNTGAQAVTVRVGETTASTTFTVTVGPILPVPPAIVTPVIAGDHSLTVTSRPPIETGGLTPINYDLRYIPTDADETVESNWTLVNSIWKVGFEPLEYVLMGLTAGTQYDIQLRAVNAAGTNPWSATATGTPSTWGAIRYLSQTYVEPGGEVTVVIFTTGYGLYGHVVETLPPGFSYMGSSLSEDAVVVFGQKVIFFLSGQTDLNYTVTASAAAGNYFFSGDLVNENGLQQTVGGAASIRVGVGPLVNAYSFSRSLVRIAAPIQVLVAFSEPVFGFALDDISVSNGVAGNFGGSDGSAHYEFYVTPDAVGAVTVDIAAGAATDAEGNGNTAALTFSLGIPYDDDHDGGIGKEEAITAVLDYFAGRITKEEAIGIIILYFSS